ncbi:membrane protein [Pandoraea captiosa]|uniref:Membrane protein n=1 Tax=Pandoraea captiosa TaxID=2508302 RepID=A0A5E5AF29_9BURK|nr:YeeE/YedE family protein [Pandoraea captiosa]VVE72194.1 membrane protein [Pandoraea captiosa]
MKKLVFAWVGGLVFGLGLILAGMANPAKVLGFLDVAGKWDPSLAFVMGGAIAVGFVGFRLARTRALAWTGEPRVWPSAGTVDKRLVIGALLFGVGWGIAGICPGPALVLLGAGSGKALWFVVAMVVGMAIHAVVTRSDTR